MESFSYKIQEEDSHKRIDLFLTDRCHDLTRSYIQKLISDGLVTVNGKQVKANYKIKLGDEVNILIPPPIDLTVEAEEIPLEILYEDADVIVVNKPQGMVVHPASGNYSGTLVNALLKHCKDLSGINGVIRPGIVHRLDKDTSGVIMAAKNDEAHLSLAAQIKARTVNRRYFALVRGNLPQESGTINAPIGRHPTDRKKMAVVFRNSKQAITHFQVRERFGDYTLIEAKLETGRTHQIRVHMSYLGFPVVGDPKYGPKKQDFNLQGQFLHAYLLGFYHPRTGKYLEFTAPLPAHMERILESLRKRR